MFPWNYGFHWTPGTILFMGAFYAVLVVIAATLVKAGWRGWRDLRLQKADAIRWYVDFHDLPAQDRACRHEITGETGNRKCPHAFDCRVCEAHPKFVAALPPELTTLATLEEEVFGMPFPADRLYHRGHTWVKAENDGTLTVGMDELGKRLIGPPERVELPPEGKRLHANGTAWKVRKRGIEVRVLSPVDGVVVATGAPQDDWCLKVKPAGGALDDRRLLRPYEVRSWIMRDLERIQMTVGGSQASLADGGVLLEDVSEVYPKAEWDDLCGRVFLHP